MEACGVDELILSNALGTGGNPVRRAALAVGLPESHAGLITDRQCAGGMDAADVMEAYAVQALACIDGAGLQRSIVNQGGGALARGHPIGASGAINAVRLFHDLAKRGGGTDQATIAATGGIGSALVLRAR